MRGTPDTIAEAWALTLNRPLIRAALAAHLLPEGRRNAGLSASAIMAVPKFPSRSNTPTFSRTYFLASPQACANLLPSRRTEGS